MGLLLLLATPLVAHDTGLVRAEAVLEADGRYRLDVTLDLDHLPAAPPGTDALEPRLRGLTPDLAREAGPFLRAFLASSQVLVDGVRVEPAVEVVVRERGPGVPAEDAFPLLRLTGRLPEGARTLAWRAPVLTGAYSLSISRAGGPPVRSWLKPGESSEPFPLKRPAPPATRAGVVALYVSLGFTHIVPYGSDHILFVLGLFLLSTRLRPLLLQVTAFTVAHTATLALSVFGIASLSPSIVEPLIAVSIVYVAVENVVTAELHAWRPAVVFAFGLLHGMGFAGVLQEIGLPRTELVPALLSFNAGVELGQLAVLLTAFLLVGRPFRRRPWYRRHVVVPGSVLIALVGLYWAIQRVAA